jgi:hypothetical protein
MSAVIAISFHLNYAIKCRKLPKKGLLPGLNMRISSVCKTGLKLLCILCGDRMKTELRDVL